MGINTTSSRRGPDTERQETTRSPSRYIGDR
jgi:hypothetical protein